ncbi:hypothetical protein CK228_13755 [Mesorhizobium sp. WSM4312]|uniref:hypothetical protein n=1 Tax=Mesorhizobium sp. WSM4312 TaxID=2029411 RepID=UPI000BAFA056|nr:hypothetical protein [Mesorhizobium sp. WSM4312]PBB68168.1 hypothetical protein CK228_13755 [Mesorhizobium sp. WSM4312]
MSKTTVKTGDTIRCTRATGTGGKLAVDCLYKVISFDGRYVRLDGVPGGYLITRFAPVEPAAKAKPTTFGQVRSVTVNQSDIHDVLTQYVRLGLGINATVEKIIDKFPEAVELVLKHEVAA